MNKKASDYDQEILDLFDLYVHSQINRREFLQGASKFAVGGLTATTLLESLSPQYVQAKQVDENDPRLKSEYIEYQSPKGHGRIRGLLSRPAEASGKLPGVVVIHENRGLNPHIEDVTRRAGLEGFLVLGPDALTPLGGYPGTDDEGRDMQLTLDRNEILEDFVSAVEFLESHPDCTGKIGVVGFCFGGWVSNMLAVRLPYLNASVPFYGSQPTAEDVQKINAPLLIHYASLDNRVNKGWPDYESALKQYNKNYKVNFYENVNHGFHNDTTPRYDEASAKLAWQRTVDFFNQHLKS